MKSHWNSVTWFSKTLALVLFVVLPFVGFYFGTEYGQMMEAANYGNSGGAGVSPASTTPTASTGSDYYTNVGAWQVARHDDAGFVLKYPLDFSIDDNHALTPSTDWRLNSPGIPGLKVLTITIPPTFEPQTNFADAKLTVGYSANSLAVAQCFKDDQSGGSMAPSSTVAINGPHFAVFHSSGAGAGNLYETTSYRTLHNGYCYAIEYTIHSTQLANYPAQYGLKQFDKVPVTNVLDRIVNTFTFL